MKLQRFFAAFCIGFLLNVFVLPVAISKEGARQLKIGLVLPGPIKDGTFNESAANGIRAAQAKYPGIQVSIRENTAMAQLEQALRDYGRAGYDVVIGQGFQFGEPAQKIHKEFPNTWFIVNTAKVAEAPNLASFDNRWGDAGYVAGALAALVTKSGVIGHVSGIPVPVIQEYAEGFSRGAKRMNSQVSVKSAYVGSFTDVAKAKEITLSLIEAGADVVTAAGNENVIGTLQAAKEKNVLMIGTAFDNSALAPDNIVATALINFSVNLDLAIDKILDGTIEPRTYVLGFPENGVGLSSYGRFEDKIPEETKSRIAALIEDIRAGRVNDLPSLR